MKKEWRILYRFLSAFVLAMTLAMSFAPVAQAHVDAQNRAKFEAARAAQAAAQAEAARQREASLDATQAEAQFMEAFNAYLNMPADAPLHVRLEHEAAIERATQLMSEVAAAQQPAAKTASTASDAGVTARREAGVFVWNSADLAGASQPAANTGWTVVGRPQGDRAIFENTFNEYISGATAVTEHEQATAPGIYDMASPEAASPKVESAVSTCNTCAAPAPADAASETFTDWNSPTAMQPCVAPSSILAISWNTNLVQGGDLNTWPDNTSPWTVNLACTSADPTCLQTFDDCRTGAGAAQMNNQNAAVTFYQDIDFSDKAAVIDTGLVEWWAFATFGALNFDDRATRKATYQFFPGGQEFVYEDNQHADNEDYCTRPQTGAGYVPVGARSVRVKIDMRVAGVYERVIVDELGFWLYAAQALADLSATIADAPDPVPAGDPIQYTATIANAGPAQAAQSTLNINLPPGTTNIVASGSCALSGTTLTCNIVNLPSGGSQQIVIDALAPPDPGTVTASASAAVVSSQFDENPANNSASTTTVVLPKADPYVTLTAPRAVSYLPGATTTYQVPAIVGNNGPHTAPARFTFTPPANTTMSALIAGAGTCDVSAGTCDLGDLANGATVPVTVTVSVGAGAAEGDTLTASASVALLGTTVEVDPNNNTANASVRLTLWDIPMGMSTPGGAVNALIYVNNGLYTGGAFGVRQWDGATWLEVGSGGPTGVVYSLYADGAGGFYAGGDFTNIGPRLAHWDGSAWSSVGGGLPGGTVYALTLLGNDLYVGGQFTQTATLSDVNNIALWDGAAWAGVGLAGITRGYPIARPVVRALAAGHGKVYVGGTFSTPGPNVVAWNPAQRAWEALGGGVDFTPLGGATVRSLAVLGNRVYIGGPFTSVDDGALEAAAIVAWDVDAARWATVGEGLSGSGVVSVNALAVASEGDADSGALMAAGVFATSGSTQVARIAQWNGASWTPLGAGINDGASNALAVNPATREVAVGDNFTGLDGMADPETPWVTAHGVGLYRYRPTDLALTLSALLDTPTAGMNYGYTLGVANQGDVAHDVVARLDLPEGVSFVSGTNCATAGVGGVACTLGTLANGANTSVNVTVRAEREARGELPAHAAVGAREWDVTPADNRAVYTVTVISEADLSVTLSGPATGVAGETVLVYDAAVANAGPALAFNAVLTFTFSGGIATYDAVSGFTCETVDNYADRVTVVCPLGDMEPGVSVSGQFSFTVGAATRGTLQGVLLAGSEAVDPNTGNNTATAATIVQARADVQVEAIAPALLYLGTASSELNYRLVVKHGAGPSTAQNVVLIHTLPATVVFASADEGCRYETGGHRVVCELEELGLGATAAFGMRVVVPPGSPHGTVLTAQVTVASDVQDSAPANNTATAQTQITTNSADIQANLKLTQQAAPVIAGTTAFYTLNVYNQGAVAATRFVITNTLPAGVIFDPAYSDFACAETATPGVAVCTFGALDVGQSREVIVAASVAPDTAPSTALTNQAIVRGSPDDRDLSDNAASASALVTASADLKVTQRSSHTIIDAGDLVKFTVTVVNRGPSRAQAVTVANTPPSGLVLESATPSQGTCTTTGGVVACDLGDLPLNATATVEIEMQAGVGEVVNTVSVAATTPDPLPDNNTADTALTIEGGGAQTREFGLIEVTADTFINLPNGDVQAFGNVRLGEHYYLAGESDSLIIYPDETRFRGEGTVALREGAYPLFTGYFHGLFETTITQGGEDVEVAHLYPGYDVEYKMTSLGELDMEESVFNTYSIYTVTLTTGQAEGSDARVIAEPRGMGKITMALPTFFVRPGEGEPVFGGQAEPFSFSLVGVTTTVKTAEIRSDGMYASAVMTLPWGGLTAELNELLITRNSLESLDVTVNLPNIYFVGQPLTKTVTVTTTKTITDAAGITSTLTITSTNIEDDGAPCRLEEDGTQPITDTTVAVLDPSISLVYAGGGFTFVGKGRLCTVVPDNVNDTAVSFSIDTNGNFRAQADLINLNIATAKLTMKDIAVSNTGLSVAAATLILPPDLMTATVTLQDVAINKDGLQLGGAAFSITLPDVAFGDAVRFVQPVATIKVEGINTDTPRYAFGIDTMLHLNLPSNAQKLRVMAEIDTTGKFKGSVQGISLTIASAILQIGTIEFDNSGLSADEASLTLPQSLGGVSGKLYKIRIDQRGLTVEGGAVKFPIPTFTIGGVFTFKDATATIGIAKDRTYKLTVAATVSFVVKGSGAEVKGYISIDSAGKVTGGLDSFTLTIVGLSLKVKDVKFQEGTLYIGEASLELPKALSGAAVAVYNVRIGRDGIRIGGGKFQLPEIKIASMTLGGLYAEFREEGDGYIIGAGGGITIPGLGSPSGFGLKVALVIYVEKSTNAMVLEIYPADEKPELAALAPDTTAGISRVALRELTVELTGLIPVGNTGLFITRLRGSIKISREGVVKVELGTTIATNPALIKGDVDQTIQFNPFQMDLTGAITLLYFIKAAEMKAQIKANPLYFGAEVKINLILIHGRTFINIWTQNGEFYLTGGATLTFGLPKNCILGFLPPWDLILGEIGAEFGKFVIDDQNNTAWGIKGWLIFLKWRLAGYIDTNGNLATGDDVDKYKLATPPKLAQLRRLQTMLSDPDGFYMLSDAERTELAAHTAAELADYTFADDHVSIRETVAYPTQVMFALTRPLSQNAPTLRLRAPSGMIITPEFQPGDVTYSYLETPAEASTDDPPSALMMYVVPNAEVGEWEAILDGITGAPGEGDYQFGVAVSFPVPEIKDPWAVNTGPTTARAEWELSGGNPVTTTLDVYVTTGPITATHTYSNAEGQLVSVEKPQYSGFPIAQNVPTTYDGTRSSVDLDLSDLPSGTYWVWFRVNDWRFPPTNVYAPAPVIVTREWQDTWTANLAATTDIQASDTITWTPEMLARLNYRALEVTWTPNPNPDALTYRLLIGREPDVVDTTIELGEVGEPYAYYLENLVPGQVYYLQLAAEDPRNGRVAYSEQITAFAEGMNYELTANQTEFELVAGESANLSLILTVSADPAPDVVFFAETTLPDGISLTLPDVDTAFTPTAAGLNIPVTLRAGESMVEGVYDVPVVAMGEGVRREVTLRVTVHEPRVYVTATPDTVILGQEETQIATLSAAGTYGKNTPVYLNLEGFPAGLVYNLSEGSIRPGETVALTFRDTWLLEPGTYQMQLRAGDGLMVERVPITVTVVKPFFTLESDFTGMAILAGENVAFPVKVTASGLSAPLRLEVDEWSTPLPNGRVGLATAPNRAPVPALDLAPDSNGDINRTVYLLAETSETTPPSPYTLRIQGTDGVRTRPLTFDLHVYDRNTQVTNLGITQHVAEVAPIGGLLTYTLQIANRGPIAAYTVVLTNTLPASVTLISATPERGTCTADGQTVTCDLIALRRGSLLNITLVTRVAADTPHGQALVNNAEVWATQADLTPEDNSAVSTVLAEAIADLQTTIWGEAHPATNGSVIAGTKYIYHLAVTNFGPSPAGNAQLNSTLPEGARYVSHGTQQGDCTAAGESFWCALGHLAPGQTAQVELVVAVDPLKRGELHYMASARSSERDPQPTNNTASLGVPVATDVNLNLSYQTVAPEPAIAGADMTYQLVAANTGVSDARDVIVTHTLPANVTVKSVEAGQGTCRVNGDQVVCRLGTLQARHAATLDLYLKVNPAMRHPLNHFVVVGSADADADARDNSISRRTPLITRADVAVSLASAPEPAIAGKAMVYLAAAQNLGPSDASDVVLTVTLPASVTVQNIQPAQGTCTQTGQEVVCAIGRVPSGVKMPVSIVALVPADFLSELEAGAGANGQEPDLDPTNNATTLRSKVAAHADLSIVMEGPPDYVITAVQPNQTLIPYTVTVANAGPSIANKVEVVVTLAAGVTFAYANGAVCYPTAKSVICTVGTVAAGEEHTFILYVTMAPGISGVMAHRATVGSAAHDPDLSNNSTATAAQAFKEYRIYLPFVSKAEGAAGEP